MAGKNWSKGSSRQWRKLRARILLRDKFRCQLQIPGVCTGHAPESGGTGPFKSARGWSCSSSAQTCGQCPSGHVHHKDGKEHGDDPATLEASCRACNLHVGNPAEYAAKQGPPPAVEFPAWMEGLVHGDPEAEDG